MSALWPAVADLEPNAAIHSEPSAPDMTSRLGIGGCTAMSGPYAVHLDRTTSRTAVIVVSMTSTVRSTAPVGARKSTTPSRRRGRSPLAALRRSQLRPVEGDSLLERGRRHGVGLVVDDDQAVVVAVDEVDEAFEHALADDGADVGLSPVRPGGGALDRTRVEGVAGQRGDDVGVLG
jgi:hypothetical protein